jgi:hypothetical protein
VAREPDSAKTSLTKSPQFYFGLVLLGIAVYVGWIFFSRWHQNRTIARRVEAERSEKQREEDRVAIEQLGGRELQILMFYASPATIRRGSTVRLCYGVANAKTVKLEPESGPVWSSPSRCLDVSPKKETTYTLTIDDGKGRVLSEEVTVKVL